MDRFYMIVLSVAVVGLIVSLIGVGILMRSQQTGEVFPPHTNVCPDGWTEGASTGICMLPNSGSMPNGQLTPSGTPGYSGSGATAQMNFNGADYKSICDKKKWANSLKIPWDGVSNYNQC